MRALTTKPLDILLGINLNRLTREFQVCNLFLVPPERRNPTCLRPGSEGGANRGRTLLLEGIVFAICNTFQQQLRFLRLESNSQGRKSVRVNARQGCVAERLENGCTESCSWIPTTVDESKSRLKAKSESVDSEDVRGSNHPLMVGTKTVKSHNQVPGQRCQP